MEISVQEGNYAVGKLQDRRDIGKMIPGDTFCSITVTSEEVSVVCEKNKIPPCRELQDGFSLLKIEGVLDFSLTGILAGVSDILAQAQIPIFCISTYNTDYILVRNESLEKAVQALQAQGIGISRQSHT